MNEKELLEKIPKFYEFCNPILKFLKNEATAVSRNEISEKIAEDFRIQNNLPKEIYNIKISTGAITIYDRIQWALYLYLLKMNYIKRASRGMYEITEKGIEEYPIKNVREICYNFNAENTKLKKLKESNNLKDKTLSENSDKLLNTEEQATEEEEYKWQEDLLKILRNIRPDAFEKLCKRILEKNGFTDVKVTGKSGDCGIDGIGILKINNSLISTKVVFQCKRYNENNKITSSIVREFRGSIIGKAKFGLIMSTSEFTKDAKEEAKREGVDPIELIDCYQICDLIKEMRFGIEVKMVEEVIINENLFYKLQDNE